ncbi:hypothetical protein NKG94_50355 [Micromonospora sp. M12]
MAVLPRRQPALRAVQPGHRCGRLQVQLLGTGQQLAQQHRPGEPEASCRPQHLVRLRRIAQLPELGSGGSAPMGGPSTGTTPPAPRRRSSRSTTTACTSSTNGRAATSRRSTSTATAP